MLDALALLSPGTPLRDGLDRVLQAGMGALIVVGDGPAVLNICSGGFLLDAAYSPQRLSELSKMDGAIVLAADASRIARANVHLVPNPSVATTETGTRHRTAERVGRSINVPVISVSQRMNVISVYVGDAKHQIDPVPRVIARANQAVQTLERYKTRLDEVSVALSALEVEDLVTLRDVVTVLQRTEMVARIAAEIEGYIVELGDDGRLVRLQLEELMASMGDDRRLVVRDYFHEEDSWHLAEALAALSELSDDDLVDLRGRGLGGAPGRRPPRPRPVAVAPGLPAAVPHPPPPRERDRGHRGPVRRPPEDPAGRPGGPRRRGRGGQAPGPRRQGRPQPHGRGLHPRPLQLRFRLGRCAPLRSRELVVLAALALRDPGGRRLVPRSHPPPAGGDPRTPQRQSRPCRRDVGRDRSAHGSAPGVAGRRHVRNGAPASVCASVGRGIVRGMVDGAGRRARERLLVARCGVGRSSVSTAARCGR